MSSYKKIAAVTLAAALMLVASVTCFAAGGSAAIGFSSSRGTASIGFSTGGIHYMPQGISGVVGSLDLDFGNHAIDASSPVMTYRSLDKAGYVVSNETGGASGYRVTLGLSAFDNGLEGASLTIVPDGKGLVTTNASFYNAPIFLGGANTLELEADGSTAVVMEATSADVDPMHTATGRWGFNFYGDLKVFTNTIQPGTARSVMTWEIELT